MSGNQQFDFDALVVGGRCAGSALAIHLARAGRRVAVLESAPFGSDQPSSTHLIQPPGIDELDVLGIGDEVRSLAPSLTTVRMRFDDQVGDFTYGDGRTAHCLRRSELDRRLQRAAVDAGACFRAEHRVTALLRAADGSVTGVTATGRDGKTTDYRAPVTVGADGRNSTIARLVEAPEILGYEAPRACFWAYWERPDHLDPHVIHNCFVGDGQRVVFPTDQNLVLIATAPPADRLDRWRQDREQVYVEDLRSDPTVGPLVQDRAPASAVRGVVQNRYFMRHRAGDGWALAGDAAHHKDFIVGLGITDALRDARMLAAALASDLSDGLNTYAHRATLDRVGTYYWSRGLGAADTAKPLERAIARRLNARPDIAPRLGAVLDGDLSPFRLVPPLTALRWGIADAARGSPGALLDLIEAVRDERAARRTHRRISHASRRPRPELAYCARP